MKIPLNNGLFAEVSPEDFEFLSQWKWRAERGWRTFYAVRTEHTKPRRTIRMHQVILNGKRPYYSDHIDGNGLNNTRENLRLALPSDSNGNQERPYKTRGVYRYKNRKKAYTASIQKHGKPIRLGYFYTEEEALEAYNKKGREIFGEYFNDSKMVRGRLQRARGFRSTREE